MFQQKNYNHTTKILGTVLTIGLCFFLSNTPKVLASSDPSGTNFNSNGTIYFINSQGQKQAYTSSGAFISYQFNLWSKVVPATPTDLALPSGPFVPPQDGSLINDKGTIYAISKGQRVGFANPQAFLGLGYSFSNAIPGDTSFLATLAPINSSSQAHPFDTLINQSGTIYLLTSHGKIGIPSQSIFTSWGYNPKLIVPANQYDLAISPIPNLLPTRPPGALSAFNYVILQGGGTPTTADLTAPSIPTGLTVASTTQNTVTLTWTASTDNTSVSAYDIFRNGIQVGTPALTPTFTDAGLTPSTTYSYTVVASDPSGNKSPKSSPISATTKAQTISYGGGGGGGGYTPPVDTTAPSIPTALTTITLTSTSEALSWTASTDDTAVTGYNILRNGSQVGTSSTTSYTDLQLTPSTTYSYTVEAYDAAGNTSAQSTTLSVTTLIPPDITPPTVPTGLASSSITQTSLTISWNSSTDDTAVTGYNILRNGSQVGTSTTTSFNDSGLTASTTYTYTVEAYDAASNTSAPSTGLGVTTSAVISNGPNQTWFVRADGGTRYSTNVTNGQCDGLADVAYPGTGVNQHCAFNDVRYMWDDDSGRVGAGAWVIAGGDTVVIRGCSALPGQENASNPDCRLGWDGSTGNTSDNWCYGIGSYTCYNPPIPAGTSQAHTKILGQCAYGTYTCTPINNKYPYGSTNETQLFGGFSLTWTFNLSGTQNVDVEGIELTTHNGKCIRGGTPAYPQGCSSNQPVDDYAQNGIITDNTTANLTLQDVYIHGFNSAGLYGPIGGAITATRLFTGFNGFAGWNFADTNDTPDAAGSSINANYVTMIANGCYEQYPIVNTQFPAQSCYDDLSQGFGDAWSGQDTPLDTLTCNHCVQMYNTKDGFIGPHTQIKHLTIINSASIGNMGEQWKFGTDTNATVVFENNLTEGNSYRMTAALPGAAQNFSLYSGLPGSYLSDFGRAGGDMFSIITQPGSTLQFSGNSMVLASQTGMDFNCGLVNHAGSVTGGGTCGSVPIVWTNNLFVGYNDPNCASCGNLVPGLWYKADSSINFTSSNNLEFGIRNGDTCGTSGIICTDPMLVNEPAQAWPGSEAALDVFNPFVNGNSFNLTSSSPLIGAGTPISGLTTDYYGNSRPNPPTIGAVEAGNTSN